LTVTDNGALKATNTCNVNVVGWVNISPIADAGSDQVVTEGDTVMLDGSKSTDPDDGIASFHWTQTAGRPIIFDNPSAVQTFFTAPTVPSDGEDLALELTVTDSGGLKSTDSCIVMVTQIGAGPDLTGKWVSLNSSHIWCLIRANFKVENLGTQDAKSFSLYFYLSEDATLDGTDMRIGNRSVDSLGAGQAKDIILKTKYPNSTAYTYIIAQVDAGNAVSETDETNNIIASWPL
jgi:hypothetical protein